MSHLHARGVAHGRLTPNNVLVMLLPDGDSVASVHERAWPAASRAVCGSSSSILHAFPAQPASPRNVQTSSSNTEPAGNAASTVLAPFPSTEPPRLSGTPTTPTPAGVESGGGCSGVLSASGVLGRQRLWVRVADFGLPGPVLAVAERLGGCRRQDVSLHHSCEVCCGQRLT